MGVKYPKGETPVYPPRDWTCPICKKYHTKPHYAFPGQVDLSLAPEQDGRVKWGREEGGVSSCDTPKDWLGSIPRKIISKFKKQNTGDQVKKNGGQAPLFCPHCGWIDDIINIVKAVSS